MAASRQDAAKPGYSEKQREEVAKLYRELSGNVSAIARALDITRSTVRSHIRKLGGISKPLAGGSSTGLVETKAPLPGKGLIKRYIITSAQNNTHVNKKVWESLYLLADHYEAELLVGTFSYNQNAYGELAVKAGTKRYTGKALWFDPIVEDYISDERIELANGLVWCGEMNILPTADDPLSGLATYTHRKSAIFPHVKLAMRSIATMQSEPTKFNYTTGTVTLMNYIQKKAGMKAEHHHVYGGVLVEVNHEGNWWVRQLNAHADGRLQDLDVKVERGVVTVGNRVAGITWGDLHATIADPEVLACSHDMLDELRPEHQFLHDVMEGVATNHHEAKNCHSGFKAFVRGYHNVKKELEVTISKVSSYCRPWTKTVVVDSNHDFWLTRWLVEHDYRKDPTNAVLFLEMQLQVYKQIEGFNRAFHLLEWIMKRFDCPKEVRFLQTDESYTICDKRIECGMHGHLGPNGSRGSAESLKDIGRRANTAHTHSAGIYNGLYIAGTSTLLKWDYAKGPSSWSHSHVVTYPGGSRAIVTMYAGQWRA